MRKLEKQNKTWFWSYAFSNWYQNATTIQSEELEQRKIMQSLTGGQEGTIKNSKQLYSEYINNTCTRELNFYWMLLWWQIEEFKVDFRVIKISSEK